MTTIKDGGQDVVYAAKMLVTTSRTNDSLALAGVMLILGSLSWTLPALAADRESAFRGRRLAEANCAPCHALAQFDGSENAEAPPFRHLGRRRPLATLRDEMLADLFLRHAVMPDFEPDRRQVDDIVTYIESIQE
ncbi:cytochrome c [Nitratireductor mangrovi]|uniref:Cytochrome c n=1 Tax=Nitratireductor mangrovi TaxID=2599600 RepID=A0A5B8L0W8_9HYPH|nr:c-type cytochrome [Nitratireductor mangrovi]QDZ01352.1 cytochrome c [Nitratireductor mangrovi]